MKIIQREKGTTSAYLLINRNCIIFATKKNTITGLREKLINGFTNTLRSSNPSSYKIPTLPEKFEAVL
jgi:hypothetical protein